MPDAIGWSRPVPRGLRYARRQSTIVDATYQALPPVRRPAEHAVWQIPGHKAIGRRGENYNSAKALSFTFGRSAAASAERVIHAKWRGASRHFSGAGKCREPGYPRAGEAVEDGDGDGDGSCTGGGESCGNACWSASAIASSPAALG